MAIPQEITDRTKWLLHDRFGMFIHWGLYAIPARGEWVRNKESITIEDYQKYFDAFDPIDYNPKEWAKLAKQAGMKYAVLTTKHHDGFCLFDSKYTYYKATNTKAKRDLVREYVDAFKAEGLKVGFYYSLLDWHHDGYPVYGDRAHPMRNNDEYKNTERNFSIYIEYLHNQIYELMTNYGKIDLLWFDYSYDDMTDEKWEATKLVTMIREMQPDIILNNRLVIQENTPVGSTMYAGDFVSPEQIIPPEGMLDDQGDPLPWEACITLNNHWGYCREDKNYKNPREVIRMLVECVSKNGNLLLNVGPDARGNITKESIDILKEVGKWIKANGESIYGCGAAKDMPKPDWGRYTKNGKKLYAHLFERGIGTIVLPELADKLKSAKLLSDYSEVNLSKPWYSHFADGNHAFMQLTESAQLPDENDTVVELELL